MVEEVRGMGETVKMGEAGLKLFKADEAIEGDVEKATAFKAETEAKIAALEAESKALTGKDNKAARVVKDKEKAALKISKDYIDCIKVCKGLPPVHGFFIKGGAQKAKAEEPAAAAAAAPAEAEKEDKAKKEKPKKSMESTGISRDERAELEGLKQKIIDKKTALKAEGMSGGQINKNDEVAAMVTRMNELKEKETPGATTAKKDDGKSKKKGKQLDSETIKQMEEKERAFEEYTERLKSEFKYSKKEIAADPEYQEMKAELDKLKK